jgi:hypothetical protein
MKKKYSLRGILLCLFLTFINTGYCQTTLSAGDVAISSFNSDTNDEISFILLKDIVSGTEIYFTENGWDDDNDGGGAASSWGNTNEGTLKWTSTSAMTAGTQVQVITPKLNATLDVSEGTIVKYGTWSLVTTSESIIIYQGTNKPTDATEVTQFIWAFNTGSNDWTSNSSSTNTTGIPTGLIDGTNAISFTGTTSSDNLQYNCETTTLSSISTLRTSLATELNYNTDSSNPDYKAPNCFTTIWDGSTDTNWSDLDNWDEGVPVYAFNVTIPNVANDPIYSGSDVTQVNNLTIDASAILTLSSGSAITINGNLIVNGELASNSGSSIINKGTSSGNISYSRTLTTNWHLISSPVGAHDINTFTVTEVATNAIGTSGTNYGLAPYDNNGSAWEYYTTSTIAGAGNFTAAKGYSALRTSAGNITFTGTFPTSDVTIAITDGTSNEWNLIGNPYPSYIPANSGADATNNFLTINTADLNAAFQAVYFWNGSAYVPINHASDSRFIAPGQGFFVNSIASGSIIDFTEAMQKHQTTDVFSKTTATWPEITLKMTDGQTKKSTNIKYITGTTTGLDPGYDAGMFNAGSNTFNVYSHLVTDSDGTDFSLQALPDSNYEKMIIPIGINASSGKEIIFSINHQNLPAELMVFLEDRTENKIIRVDELNSDYNITLNSIQKGIGRFYLKTSTTDLRKVLDVNDYNLNQIKIYTTTAHNLRITGLKGENPRLKLYTILGKQLLNTKLDAKKLINVKIPIQIKQGIYIINLKTSSGNINRKLVLK